METSPRDRELQEEVAYNFFSTLSDERLLAVIDDLEIHIHEFWGVAGGSKDALLKEAAKRYVATQDRQGY